MAERDDRLQTWHALGDARYVNVATYRRDGREVRTPVWVARAGNALYVFSEATAGKVKRIRATRRVGVAPCDVRGGLRGDFERGVGRIVTDADEIAAAYAALRSKYGIQMWITDLMSRLTGRYDKRALLALERDDTRQGG